MLTLSIHYFYNVVLVNDLSCCCIVVCFGLEAFHYKTSPFADIALFNGYVYSYKDTSNPYTDATLALLH